MVGWREFFRTPTDAALPHFRSPLGGNSLVGERELAAATMAITSRAAGGARNIALRTDDQNVLSWAEHARSHSTASNRVLEALNMFCLQNEVGAFPAYVRSERDIFADGVTRRPHVKLADWASHEGMTQVAASPRLWAGMSLSYNPDMDVNPPPNTFALIGHILHFLRPYNYRVCDWRPSHFALASVLEYWGVPVFIDQILAVGIRDFLVRLESHPISSIGRNDIFMLIGYCVSWAVILDFRRTVSQRDMRYAAAIAPFWLRDGTESALWTSQTLIDAALAGDPWASFWMVYCAGGIASRQFDLSPFSAEVRTLVDCYRSVGQGCEAAPREAATPILSKIRRGR